jgi:acetyl esterase/lipase
MNCKLQLKRLRLVDNSILYFEAMKKAGVKVELHLYQSGGHGYGMGRELTQNSWSQSLLLWLKKNDF